MARRKGTSKYTKAEKLKVLTRIKAGETQAAVAASTGVPLATVGYWARKAKKAEATNSVSPKKRGRPAGSRSRVTSRAESAGIAWALDGDVLVIRIPLRAFARKVAEEALAKI